MAPGKSSIDWRMAFQQREREARTLLMLVIEEELQMSYARRWRTRSGRWFLIDRHGWRPVDDSGGEIDILCGFLTTGLVLAWSWLFLGALFHNNGAGGIAALFPAGIYLLCDHGWPRWVTWIVRSILWFGTFAIFAVHWPH